jgi:hypothetical protein
MTILFIDPRDNAQGPSRPPLKKRVKKIKSRSVKKEKLSEPIPAASSFLLAQ